MMASLFRSFASGLSLLGLCCLAGILNGCGEKYPTGKLVPVVGKVTLEGQPVATGGTISFRPDKSKGNTTLYEPAGEIDPVGNYKLYTNAKEGAPPGAYRIMVTSMTPIDPANPYAPTKSLLNPRYAKLETSGLAVEVVDKPAPGAYDLDLKK